MNRQLEAKTRALAGWKGYTTNLIGQPAEFVIDAYHQLWRIEKAFRMSKHDLQARPDLPPQPPIHRSAPEHRVRRDGSQPLHRAPNRLEHQEIRPDHPPLPHVKIKAGTQTLTAADPLPDDLRDALANIGTAGVH